MNDLPQPSAIAEIMRPTAEQFAELRAAERPTIMRGLVVDWPAVSAARQGNGKIVDYLRAHAGSTPISAIAAPPDQQGRFFYNADLTGFNFMRGHGQIGPFLDDLLRVEDDPQPPGMALQSEIIRQVLPGFVEANPLEILPQVEPRIWIGNRIRVAPHYDVKENVACCVAGRRRFTLFPPDQIGNLYPGPFELTPAGTPVSMVDTAAPDLGTYPKFAEAWANAQQATLEPGDAIYIPYCWWHGVESLDPVSILVNYWWNDAGPESGADMGGPYDALLHAILAYRYLPDGQRGVWRGMLDHYVFEKNGDPGAHLPEAARGVMGRKTPQLFHKIRAILRQGLGQG